MNVLNFYTYNEFGAVKCIFITLMFLTLAFGLYVVAKLPFFRTFHNRLTIGIAAGATFIFFLIGFVFIKPKKHIVYEVTIDDNFGANDLYNEYVVIDKRGNIYSIEKRDE